MLGYSRTTVLEQMGSVAALDELKFETSLKFLFFSPGVTFHLLNTDDEVIMIDSF